MDCYNQYNAKQLLQLLCVLEEDEQPSRELFETKVQIRIIAAKKLNVGVNDVIKLSKKKKVEQELRKVNEDLRLSKIKHDLHDIRKQLHEITYRQMELVDILGKYLHERK